MQIIALVIGVISFVGLVIMYMQQSKLTSRLTSILGATEDTNLEEQLVNYAKHVKEVDSKFEQLINSYQQLKITNELASQKISVVRFNPFGDTGGDQSFSLAVLDAHDSGYVLSSIHGREGTRVYVKPVDLGKSKYQLSNEEKQALAQAAKRVPTFMEEKDEQEK